jgi:hypothetical protein
MRDMKQARTDQTVPIGKVIIVQRRDGVFMHHVTRPGLLLPLPTKEVERLLLRRLRELAFA